MKIEETQKDLLKKQGFKQMHSGVCSQCSTPTEHSNTCRRGRQRKGPLAPMHRAPGRVAGCRDSRPPSRLPSVTTAPRAVPPCHTDTHYKLCSLSLLGKLVLVPHGQLITFSSDTKGMHRKKVHEA